MRTGVQAMIVVAVDGLVFFLLGVAKRTKWMTADGFSGGKGEAVAEAGGGDDIGFTTGRHIGGDTVAHSS